MGKINLIFVLIFLSDTLLASDCQSQINSNKNIDSLVEKWIKLVEKSPNSIYPETNFSKVCEAAKADAKLLKESDTHMKIGVTTDFTIKEKSYSGSVLSTKDPLFVSLLTREYLKCSDKQYCAGVKHFPNLGILGNNDPHVAIPKKNAFDMRESNITAIKPIAEASKMSACSVMVSHIPFIGRSGTNRICSLNKECINYLKNDLGYNGLVITDELQVMKPTLYEIWDIKYRPTNKKEQEEWDKILWTVDPKIKASSFHDWATYDKWMKTEFKKRYDYVYQIVAKRKCENGKCNSEHESKIKSELEDINVSERAKYAINAGNDIIMIFHEGGKQKVRTKAMIVDLVQAVSAGEINESVINEAVTKILKRKEVVFGDALYKNFQFSANEKTIDNIIKNLTIEEKLKQMIVVSGNSPGETPIAYQENLGSVYYFGLSNREAQTSIEQAKEVDANTYNPKIPLLRMGDVFGPTN